MSYHGIEIFFQSLGDADSIFVRHWDQGTLTNILIDGGYRKDHEQVVGFLNDRADETGENTIHHLVCSHCHDDHAGGLVKLVTDCPEIPIEVGWVHDTRQQHATLNLQRELLLRALHANRLLESVQASEQTRINLLNALENRGVPTYSPFAGDQIGPLFVLGPSESFFDEQFKKLDSGGQVKALNERFEKRYRDQLFGVNQVQLEAADAQKELGGEPTSPENEVSTVLAAIWDGKVNLFTADAGCEGLSAAIGNPHQIDTQDLRWMQVPHHGSRRNLNQDLIDHFSPTTAFISCSGTVKHPSKKLVNALKATGAKVYSTHYSTSKSGWLRHAIGDVPNVGTVPAIPLYEKSKALAAVL